MTPCGDVRVNSHVFEFVNELVVIEWFIKVHDNDISLLTLILTDCYFLGEADELSLTAVFFYLNLCG